MNRRWVIKIGSSLLTDPVSGLYLDRIDELANQSVQLIAQGIEVVLVSSGAIVEGMKRLGWQTRPHALHKLQAAASIGQMGLAQAYETAFQKHGRATAQILLTDADMANRQRYLNARSTLRTLLELDVVPVINENDTVVTEEIRFGDNDTLGALVCNLVDAERLVILTDQQGLYDKDPAQHADASLVSVANAGDKALEKMAGPGTALSRGGMLTKIQAAEKATRSGAETVIAYGREKDVLLRLAGGEKIGTLLQCKTDRLAARKQWMAGQLRVNGSLALDDGAIRVLKTQGKSLLPVGVKAVNGSFLRGELVACVDTMGQEIARGFVNYSADEARQIMGKPSARIESILGYADEPELIHRDDIVVFV
ncbi:MAG: glutamate 5-kinase [Arenicellales bacterium WSBS_2016_MAG_OTU3]